MIMAQKEEQSVSWKTKAEDKEKKNLKGSGHSKMGIQVCFIPKIYKSRHELRLKIRHSHSNGSNTAVRRDK